MFPSSAIGIKILCLLFQMANVRIFWVFYGENNQELAVFLKLVDLWHLWFLMTLTITYQVFLLFLKFQLKQMLYCYLILGNCHLLFFMNLVNIYLSVGMLWKFLVEAIITYHVLFMWNIIFLINNVQFW